VRGVWLFVVVLVPRIAFSYHCTTDHLSYEESPEALSVGYRELTASTAQRRNTPTHLKRRTTPSANPTYKGWTPGTAIRAHRPQLAPPTLRAHANVGEARMPNYRRALVPGASWFFTVNLLQRCHNDLLVRNIDVLRASVRRVHILYPFTIDA